MKGQRALFDNLIPVETREFKKGRSARLISRRDEFLMVRYFYYLEVKRLRYDDILKVLSEDEFFIETKTVLDRLNLLMDKVAERFRSKPTLAKLKELSGNFVVDVTQKERERYEKCL